MVRKQYQIIMYTGYGYGFVPSGSPRRISLDVSKFTDRVGRRAMEFRSPFILRIYMSPFISSHSTSTTLKQVSIHPIKLLFIFHSIAQIAMPPTEEVTFKTLDGLSLCGRLYPAASRGPGIVITPGVSFPHYSPCPHITGWLMRYSVQLR